MPPFRDDEGVVVGAERDRVRADAVRGHLAEALQIAAVVDGDDSASVLEVVLRYVEEAAAPREAGVPVDVPIGRARDLPHDLSGREVEVEEERPRAAGDDDRAIASHRVGHDLVATLLDRCREADARGEVDAGHVVPARAIVGRGEEQRAPRRTGPEPEVTGQRDAGGGRRRR
jgi:hypothetical protein